MNVLHRILVSAGLIEAPVRIEVAYGGQIVTTTTDTVEIVSANNPRRIESYSVHVDEGTAGASIRLSREFPPWVELAQYPSRRAARRALRDLSASMVAMGMPRARGIPWFRTAVAAVAMTVILRFVLAPTAPQAIAAVVPAALPPSGTTAPILSANEAPMPTIDDLTCAEIN